VNVTWNDAVAFCEWLNKKEGKNYRLPREAEWEYACRAGTTTKYYHGDDPEGLATIGNVADRSFKNTKPSGYDWGIESNDGYVFTAPAGRFKPNAFGLYDMTGNVWEWCDDWYDAKFYATSRVDDPAGYTEGSNRVLRGGSWNCTPAICRSARRNWVTPDDRSGDLGFRVALVP
jgi:formylglycine-generating enzyme required for sulfatase activity